MDDLNGRVAVVTGGGSGIGRGIALALGAEGMTVAVADVRRSSAEAVAAEIASAGGSAVAIGVDVTSAESLAAASKEVAARAGRVNLLCANAGVLARVGPLVDHTFEDWEYTLSVNVMGIVKTVATFLPALRESAPEAHIVTTASLGGLVSDVRAPIGAYIASKYACVGYSEILRAELAGEGIGVSVLCPGVVTSNLMATSAENRHRAFGAAPRPQLAAGGGGAGEASAPPLPAWAMAAEDVGPIAIRAIRAQRFYVLTHPRAWPLVEGRFGAMRADFEFASGG